MYTHKIIYKCLCNFRIKQFLKPTHTPIRLLTGLASLELVS